MKLHVQTGGRYKVHLSGQQTIPARINAPIVVRPVQGEVYNGEYTVVPSAHNEQVLETSGLTMRDDVTVLRVPYFETSNPFGETIYIASEV